jgi:hypothetical protein
MLGADRHFLITTQHECQSQADREEEQEEPIHELELLCARAHPVVERGLALLPKRRVRR